MWSAERDQKDQLIVIDGWDINDKIVPESNEDEEPRTVTCGQTIRMKTSSNVASVKFSLSPGVSFKLDWSTVYENNRNVQIFPKKFS